MRALGLYKGTVSHSRSQPKPHRFGYFMMQVWVDLQQLHLLDEISPFWSSTKRNLVRFRSQNYLPSETSSDPDLYQRVAKQVHAHTGKAFNGRAYLLANLSYWGYCFNPIAFVFCYDNDELSYLVTEVRNTPWGERCVYVHDILAQQDAKDEKGYYHATFDKKFHVSPFMPMALQYHWAYKISDGDFLMNMNLYKDGQAIFNVTVDLSGQSLTATQAHLIPFRYPFTCLKVITAIYWQAFQLWLKKLPFHPHTTSK